MSMILMLIIIMMIIMMIENINKAKDKSVHGDNYCDYYL